MIRKDQQQELKLRADRDQLLAAIHDKEAMERQLQMELATSRNLKQQKELREKLDAQKKELRDLNTQSNQTAQELAKHKGDQASQDTLLKGAYAQIDSLQAQLNQLRQGKCAANYVPRNAVPGDRVCVSPEVARQVANDNIHAEERRAGGGPYGPDTCKEGYVWREATPGDHVCVEPGQREQAARDNRQAQYRLSTGSQGVQTAN